MEKETKYAPEIALNSKAKLTGKVIKTTLAGAILDIGQDLPGVIHISQLKSEAVNKVEDCLQVGQEAEVWVRRVREDRIELTMIEPFELEWREIKPEMVVKGKITRLEPYGAFIEIGAERPGLVHVSEISHGFIKSPSDILKEGDEVEATVLEVNRRKKQIRLSIKANLPKPEETLVSNDAPSIKSKAVSRKPKRNKPVSEEVPMKEITEQEKTVFEMAWQEALQKAENKKDGKSKRTRNSNKVQEDLLNRTLESRLPTG